MHIELVCDVVSGFLAGVDRLLALIGGELRLAPAGMAMAATSQLPVRSRIIRSNSAKAPTISPPCPSRRRQHSATGKQASPALENVIMIEQHIAAFSATSGTVKTS
jgi:hypothetical protein